MTARTAAAAASLVLALSLSACNNFYEVPIETPIQPKMDVSAFQRVLIAGFLAGGSEDVDANLETVRLLRSQLRSKSQLKVIDADVLPLLELANEQRTDKPAADAAAAAAGGAARRQRPRPRRGPRHRARPMGPPALPAVNRRPRRFLRRHPHRLPRPPTARARQPPTHCPTSVTKRTSSRSRASSRTWSTGRRSARNIRTR